MSLYVITLVCIAILYVEITRRRENKRVTAEIKVVKDEVKHHLEMFNQMFDSRETASDVVITPPVCRTEIQKKARVLRETTAGGNRKEGIR